MTYVATLQSHNGDDKVVIYFDKKFSYTEELLMEAVRVLQIEVLRMRSHVE